MTTTTRIALTMLAALALTAPLLAAANTTNAANTKDADTGTVTFYKDVLPIVQEKCQACHRPNGANLGGMVAPMAFTSYEETRPWARAIARKVESGEMPPWHAAPEQSGLFLNERSLDEKSRATILRWAKTGARAGDPADAPPPKEYPPAGGWSIGEPDLIVSMPEVYTVADDVEDRYVTFESVITEEMLPEPRWMKAVEFRPGSPVVHHIIARPLGGIAPGNDPTVYQDGFGVLLKPGTKIRWQMHYHKEPGPGTAVDDQSQAAIKFYPEGYEPEYLIQGESLGKVDFEIPPGDPDYSAHTSFTFDRDSLIVGYTPHMHLRGKAAKYIAVYPDGTEEVLLEVPRYDFNWQTTYQYKDVKPVPAGTRVDLTMWWDNSPDNPYNPNPEEAVRFGRPTTAEMMFGFMSFVDAEPGYRPPYSDVIGGRRISPERLRAIVKERFGVDIDELSDEERQELFERFRAARQGAESSGD